MNEQTFKLMMSSKGAEWYTPLDLYRKLDGEFQFHTDPCAEPSNRLGCKLFYTKEQNGLDWNRCPWYGNVFINPPYGKEMSRWVAYAYDYGANGLGVAVMLIPARTDTSWFHKYIWRKPWTEIRFLKGRLKFENPEHTKNTAPFPSMIVIFREASEKQNRLDQFS